MSTAVLLATAAANDGSCAALLQLRRKSTLLSNLIGQLRKQGVDEVRVLTRLEWVDTVSHAVAADGVIGVASLSDSLTRIADLAQAGTGPLLLGHGEILTHDSVLAGLLNDPRVPSGIVSGKPQGANQLPHVRIERGRVIASESAYHRVTRRDRAFLGLLKVAGTDRAQLASVARSIAALCRDQLPPKWEPELAAKVRGWGAGFFRRNGNVMALADQLEREVGSHKWLPDAQVLRTELDTRFRTDVLLPAATIAEDSVSLLLTGLCRDGVVLTVTSLRDLFWARPLTAERVALAVVDMAAVDEDRVMLDSAVKASDGFFTTFFVSTYSRYIARWAARRKLTPNQITVFSMFLGVLAAAAFAIGTRPWLIAGALLLQAAFTADCVDGQLARYTRQFSKLGAWLDSVFDRGKEYVVFAGLALGGTRNGAGSTIWLLACAAIAMQTTRHAIDFGYSASEHLGLSEVKQAPMDEPEERITKRKGPVADALHGYDDDIVEDMSAPSLTPRTSGLSAIGRAGVTASRYFEQRRWMKWAKRMLVLPIGERFALISVTAALFGPRVTFISLFVWGGVAGAYVIAGRVLRSVA
jgi:phosphatidylglycerophosphate synthase